MSNVGGRCFKKANDERIVVSYEEAREKFPGKFLPSQKRTFLLKNNNKKRLDQTISPQSWLGPAFLRGPHPLDVSLLPCNKNK